MSTSESFFDNDTFSWREVTGELFSHVHYVRHDYTILAHDSAAGTLDMLIRWRNDGGHCPLHRHTATTTSVLVLEGEQHVRDILPDGTLAPLKVRRAGEYALLLKEPLAHLEGGGPNGGLAFFGCHTTDGRLYELVDDDGGVLLDVTIDFLVADFAVALENG
jgi:hypothetical protein